MDASVDCVSILVTVQKTISLGNANASQRSSTNHPLPRPPTTDLNSMQNFWLDCLCLSFSLYMPSFSHIPMSPGAANANRRSGSSCNTSHATRPFPCSFPYITPIPFLPIHLRCVRAICLPTDIESKTTAPPPPLSSNLLTATQ